MEVTRRAPYNGMCISKPAALSVRPVLNHGHCEMIMRFLP